MQFSLEIPNMSKLYIYVSINDVQAFEVRVKIFAYLCASAF